MDIKDIIAQGFGIAGLIVMLLSFQFKNNKTLFVMQGVGSLFFVVNFTLIGAVGGALFNIVIFIRALLFLKRDKLWKLYFVVALYSLCMAFSVYTLKGDLFGIFISALPFLALLGMTYCMWKGNGRKIRYAQILYLSPAWIIHNIVNLSIGGIISDTINIISSIVALVRHKNSGWETEQ